MSVQALWIPQLLANDASLTELEIYCYTNDAELKLILDAAKKNKTVKKVSVVGTPDFPDPYGESYLSVPAELSLASLVSEHPEIQEIELYRVRLIKFGAIALAIQQNLKFTRLLFDECELTPNLVECIRWLLRENALESLTLKECNGYRYEEPSFDRFEVVSLVAQAAEGHASLNKLAITYPDESYYEEPSAEDVINHGRSAEAIGTMLHNAPALRELSLSNCFMGSAGARHLADGLSSKTCVVEKVDLSDNNLGDAVGSFARVLSASQNLTSLDLRNNNIGDAGALELAVALRHNKTLELLDLMSNDIGSDGTSALADALVANDALKDLSLRENSIGDDGATSIAEMLTRNQSIEKVCIGGFGEKGLQAFATCLSSMNGLKTLEVTSRGYTSEIGNSFALALEQNTALETFDFAAMSSDFEVMPQLKRLLALNRGGRRLLSATGESAPPLNYWPRILARSF
jgi:hypothetical protein